MRILPIIAAAMLALPSTAWTHPGNVDSDSCHTERRTGKRHCHPERATMHNRRGPSSDNNTPRQEYNRPTMQQGLYSGTAMQHQVEVFDSRKIYIASSCEVTDGDTVVVRRNGAPITIRLYGIDAPEGKQPGGNESTAALRRLMVGATKIQFAPMTTDRYGRTVALLWADGKPINKAMIGGGHAWMFAKYCTEKFCAEWKQMEEGAKKAGLGLWEKPGAIPPWEWRKTHR